MLMDAASLDAFKSTIRRFVRERLVPVESEVSERDAVPAAIIKEMAELGLFGLTIPEEYGGSGLSLSEEIEITMELSWAAAAFRSLIGINIGIGSQAILSEGAQAQKNEWLPRLAEGEFISFCLTEPDSGSDSAALLTRAVREGDEYVINGSKRYITNAPLASVFLVMARTHPERLPKNKHVSALLVPAGTPGVSVGQPYKKMGQQGAILADVYFDDVRIPFDSLLGEEEGEGFNIAMKALDRGRLHVSALCVGQARRLLHEMLDYATNRKQFGKPLSEFQMIQSMLADSQTDLLAAESLLRQTAARYERGERVLLNASACKMFSSEMVGRIADRAVQILGGAGYIREHVVERLYRDVRVFRIFEGTTQIQQIIIAREMLKEFADA